MNSADKGHASASERPPQQTYRYLHIRQEMSRMEEYSRIVIEKYCASHAKTQKNRFLQNMVQKSYDLSYVPTDSEVIYLQ